MSVEHASPPDDMWQLQMLKRECDQVSMDTDLYYRTGRMEVLAKVRCGTDIPKFEKRLDQWKRTLTPERYFFVIRLSATDVVDVTFVSVIETQAGDNFDSNPMALSLILGSTYVVQSAVQCVHDYNWGDQIQVYSHHRPTEISQVLDLVANPINVEIFTDQFYDFDGLLEKRGLWLSRRNDEWRLKFTIESVVLAGLLFTQITTDIKIIEQELLNVGITQPVLMNHTDYRTSDPILTFRVTTRSAGIIDLAQFENNTLYAVMAQRVHNPSPPPFDDLQTIPMTPIPSRLFALRQYSANGEWPTSLRLSTIPTARLPPAILRYVSDIPSEVWDCAILSRIVSASRLSKLCANGNARDKFWKLIVSNAEQFTFEELASMLDMNRDARAVQALEQIMCNKPPVQLERSVAGWLDQLFAGAFEPCVGPAATSTPTESLAQSWPGSHRKLRVLIEDHAILPEEICGALNIDCDHNVRRMLTKRGGTLRIPDHIPNKITDHVPDCVEHVRTRFACAVRKNIHRLQFGSIKDTTPRGRARRLVSQWSLKGNQSHDVGEVNSVASVELMAFDLTLANASSIKAAESRKEFTGCDCIDQLVAIVHIDSSIGSHAQDSDSDTHSVPKKLQELIAELQAIDNFNLHINVKHIVPWMLQVQPNDRCPVDRSRVGISGSPIYVRPYGVPLENHPDLPNYSKKKPIQLTFTTVVDPEGSCPMHVITCAHGFKKEQCAHSDVHDVFFSTPAPNDNGFFPNFPDAAMGVSPCTMNRPPATRDDKGLDIAVLHCSQVLVGVVQHWLDAENHHSLHFHCDDVDARENLHQPFTCIESEELANLKVSKTGGVTKTTTGCIDYAKTRKYWGSADLYPPFWLMDSGAFGKPGDSGAPVYSFSTSPTSQSAPTSTSTSTTTTTTTTSTSTPTSISISTSTSTSTASTATATAPDSTPASLIGMLVGSCRPEKGDPHHAMVLPLDRILYFLSDQ